MLSREYILGYPGTQPGSAGHTRVPTRVDTPSRYTGGVLSRECNLGYPGTQPGYAGHTRVSTRVDTRVDTQADTRIVTWIYTRVHPDYTYPTSTKITPLKHNCQCISSYAQGVSHVACSASCPRVVCSVGYILWSALVPKLVMLVIAGYLSG